MPMFGLFNSNGDLRTFTSEIALRDGLAIDVGDVWLELPPELDPLTATITVDLATGEFTATPIDITAK